MVNKVSKITGFTIVEVVLVLAITGLMLVGALIAVRGSVDNQKYNDTIDSFYGFLQDQYNSLSNVEITSRTQAIPVNNACDFVLSRGRTDCVVLGKLLKFESLEADGVDYSRVVVRDVIGSDLASKGATSDDDYFSRPQLKLSALTPTEKTYELEWMANATYKPADSLTGAGSDFKNKKFYILIIRSGLTNSIRTYIADISYLSGTSDDRSVELSEIVAGNNWRNFLAFSPAFCINPAGINFINKRAIVLKPNGANSSAIEIAPLNGEVNGVKAVKCD